jgi:hypothetical protein
MKKNMWFAGGLLFCLSVLSAQEIIKNPEQPNNPAAGRIPQLREIVRLSDESGEFYFKYPQFVKRGGDESLYILDSNQLLHFDSRGKFLGNYFKKGQGPGELNFVSNIDFDGDAVVAHSYNPDKLVWLDGRGRLIRDISLVNSGGRGNLLFFDQTTFYHLETRMPRDEVKSKIGRLDGVLRSISADGRTVKELTSFPIRMFLVDGAMMYDAIVTVPLNRRYLAVSHTKEYAIKLYDCRKPGLLRVFDRKYKRVAAAGNALGPAIKSKTGTLYKMPDSEWADDVAGLFAYEDVLWVQTSTHDKDKGILFDVFNLEGKYIDAFFLKSTGRLLGVQGDVLFIRETTPEQTIQIAGYRIVD